MIKAVLYARVSSERQAEKDLSISSQLKALRSFASKNAYTISREFIDEAESARTSKRPAFQEMVSLAKSKNKPFDVVLVWKLSRFARNRKDSIIYKSLLSRRGIKVISINEKIDDSPAGRMFEGMIEVVDEFYSANLAQDTKRGMRESASRGFYTGGIPPIGYKTKPILDGGAKRKTLEIDKDFASIIERIFKLALADFGAKEIAKKLNTEGIKTNRNRRWSKNIILYILRNEVYIGTLVWGKSDPTMKPLRIENNFPAIVNESDFRQVQDIISNRSPKICRPRTLSSPYLLSGLIYCGECGYALQGGSAKSGKYHYYSCNNSIRKGKTVCKAKMINKDRIEDIIIDNLKLNILTDANLKKLLQLTNQAIEQLHDTDKKKTDILDKEVSKQQRKLDNLYNILETGKLDVDDIAPRIKEIRGSINGLNSQRELLTHKTHRTIPAMNSRQLALYINSLRTVLSEGQIFEQKNFIKSFVKRVTVNTRNIALEYTYPLNDYDESSYMDEVLCSELKSSPK